MEALVRSNLDRNKAQNIDIQSAQFGINRISLIANIVLAEDGPAFNFLEASGANRDVTLSANKRGAMVGVINYGASNSLVVKTPAGSTLATLQVSEGALFVCSGQEWRWFAYNPTAYLDPSEISSPDTTITVTTVGNAVTIEVNEPAVDHNTLLNFVVDKHVAHTSVSVGAGIGLTGGGDISASRTISMDITGLVAETPVLADELAFYDISLTTHKKLTGTSLNAILDHNALLNYSANRHIDHSTTSVTAGAGLSGGGTIDTTRTLSLDINGLSSDALALTNEFAFYDTVGLDHNKATLAALQILLRKKVIRVEAGAGPFTVVDEDVFVSNKAVLSNTAIALPPVATYGDGRVLDYMDYSGNAGEVTFTANGAETVEGSSTHRVDSGGAGFGGKASFIASTALSSWIVRG